MEEQSKKVIIIALFGNLFIAVSKFASAFITGSSAILSEGIHSLIDTGNEGFLLLGLHMAKKPADELHPFGHGKEIYFWSFVVAILIFAVGSGISVYEGIHNILHPAHIENTLINYIVIGIAFMFEGTSWTFALKNFNKMRNGRGYIRTAHTAKDPSTFIVLFEDSAALAGLIIAGLGIFLEQTTGNTIYDSLASIIIGLILAVTASWLAYETKGLLIGESASREIISEIKSVLSDFDAIGHVNEILTMHVGPHYILVNLSVEFKDLVSAVDVENNIELMDKKIKSRNGDIKRIFIESESFKKKENTG
ncbi:MAG TPA: cation diffusion facilitator family transporter [Ignavibacteriaceae bacterium]|nr:cation diffusion facilitator family transporter [Ignavibacteriaceae bacterium]